MHCVYNLLKAYLSQDRFDEAESLALEVVKVTKVGLRESNWGSWQILGYQVAMLFEQIQSGVAERIFADLVESFELVLGKTNDATLLIMARHAEHMLDRKKHQEGYQYARDVLQRFEETVADRPPVEDSADKHVTWLNSTSIRWTNNDAEEMLKSLLGLSRTTRGEIDPGTLLIMLCLAFAYSHFPSFKRSEGQNILKEVREIALVDLGANHRWKIICHAAYVTLKEIFPL